VGDKRIPGNGEEIERTYVCPWDATEIKKRHSRVAPLCHKHRVRMVEKRPQSG
jgi:hypothetical protein